MFYSESKPMDPAKHSGSLFNQKYFEGYRRAITMDESGRMRVEFVYEGIYYTRTVSESLPHKLCFILAPLVSIAMVIRNMSARTPMNYVKAVMFFQILLLFLLFLNLICGAVRCSAKEKLTQWEYRMSSLSVKEISAVSILVSAVLSVVSLARMVTGPDPLMNLYKSTAVYILAAVLQGFLMAAAMREKYMQTESEDVLNGIDVTQELSPMDDPDSGYWR